MNEKTKATFLVPAGDYQRIVEQVDESGLGEGFVGRWPTREDFGLHLLADTSALMRLAELPRWLRNVVRLDGEAFVAELEADGVFVITNVESGICVFDGDVVKSKTK